MPYTAITPFRTAVQNLVRRPYPRLLPALDRRPGESVDELQTRREAARIVAEWKYRGRVGFVTVGPIPDPRRTDDCDVLDDFLVCPSDAIDGTHTIAIFTYDNVPHTADWTYVGVLDYQGGDANNPEAKFDPGEEFISVTELPDGVQGNYLSGRPRGRLEVTEQIDLWHPWRVAVDDLADYICHRLDGRSIQLTDGNDILPGIGTIRVGVRSVLPIEAGSRMVRLSQRFMVSGHD